MASFWMAVPGDFGCFYIVVPACEEVRPFFISILRQRLLGARPFLLLPWQQDVVQRRLRCECRSNGRRLEQQPGHPQHQPFRTHNHKMGIYALALLLSRRRSVEAESLLSAERHYILWKQDGGRFIVFPEQRNWTSCRWGSRRFLCRLIFTFLS